MTANALEAAVEVAKSPGDKVVSHLHPEGSFDLSDHPVPTGREEIWRFTPLKRLRGLHNDADLSGGDFTVKVDAAAGVSAESLDVGAARRGESGLVPRDRVSARAWAAATSAFVVDVPSESEIDGVTTVTLIGNSAAQASAAHLIVRLGKFAKATVVVRFEGSATLAENVEIVVGDSAQLTLVTLQDWADDTVHHSTQYARVGRDASMKHVVLSFGGDLIRTDVTADYAGPGGSVEMLGLSFADGGEVGDSKAKGQHIEHRLFVDHNEPRTSSNVIYKSALQGQGAHTVWVGNVLIRKEAEGIETYEENRNLILTDGCQADSVPNLEIETGEIEGAGHASATGRFDDQQLFYLQSRGIAEAEARTLVVRGFFHDIVRKIGVPELEEQLSAMVDAELDRNVLNRIPGVKAAVAGQVEAP